MSEIDNLLNELRKMKSAVKEGIQNNRDTWSKIGKRKLTELGFTSEEELEAWLELNPYSNLAN